MITHLRERHRRTWLLLAVLVPAVLIVAWRARRPVATMDQLPAALRTEAKP